ncbi:arsenate reductase family protein [Lentzea tibetensis]|uniref:Arsenate reductase family protein n=2 Tax=Lentzea tibetensis TaxID=2591470 RepID=A0A563EPM1_9PSEU|nr:arsenate reductase family protein [Lentzea tibetensis]TWP49402.1 arsenate reductase family protein [Lentzea tibetensis]
MEIWHNPRCSKSRAAKQALDDAGVEYTERRYLDAPPTEAELDHVLTLLDKEPWEITRKGEPRYKELNLKDEPLDRAQWIKILSANPVLIERPIVIRDDSASVER